MASNHTIGHSKYPHSLTVGIFATLYGFAGVQSGANFPASPLQYLHATGFRIVLKQPLRDFDHFITITPRARVHIMSDCPRVTHGALAIFDPVKGLTYRKIGFGLQHQHGWTKTFWTQPLIQRLILFGRGSGV
ncbi:Uncharacterised protein [Vibrio cholerae]|nr:Uncharacterised protein [Vibrio cholerae]CSC50952.1 Uncharacterised protein [Vibrio cholerae]